MCKKMDAVSHNLEIKMSEKKHCREWRGWTEKEKKREAEKQRRKKTPQKVHPSLSFPVHGSPGAFLGNSWFRERLFQTNVGSTGVKDLGAPAWIFVHHAKK